MNRLGISDVDYGILSKLAEALDDENSELLFFEASTLDGIIRMKLLDVTDEEDFDGRTFILCVDASDDNKIYLDEEGNAHLKILEFRDGVNLAEVDDMNLLEDLAEYFEAALLAEAGIEDEFDVSDGLSASAIVDFSAQQGNQDTQSVQGSMKSAMQSPQSQPSGSQLNSWSGQQFNAQDTGGIGDFDTDFSLDGIEIAGMSSEPLPDVDQFLRDTSNLSATGYGVSSNQSNNSQATEDFNLDGDFDDEYI